MEKRFRHEIPMPRSSLTAYSAAMGHQQQQHDRIPLKKFASSARGRSCGVPLHKNNQKNNFFFLSPNSLAKGLRATCEIRRAPKSPRATLTFYPESLALSDSAQLKKKIFFPYFVWIFLLSLFSVCLSACQSREFFFLFFFSSKKNFFCSRRVLFCGRPRAPLTLEFTRVRTVLQLRVRTPNNPSEAFCVGCRIEKKYFFGIFFLFFRSLVSVGFDSH